MKRIDAQFRPRWRPGRSVLSALTVLAACAVLVAAVTVWEQQRVAALRAQIAILSPEARAENVDRPPHATPVYDASARQFLRERAAGWAPMLRTLESGSMIGVTPTLVEFSAIDGSARVELSYSNSAALIDYLGRINEGVSPGEGLTRWTLVETRLQPDTGASNGSLPGTTQMGGSVALIRSSWLDRAVTPLPGGITP